MKSPELDENGQLISDLWLDQADAEERIAQRLQAGELDEFQAETLHSFHKDGFLSFQLEDCSSLFERLHQDVDRIWKDKPIDLALRHTHGPTSMADSSERRDRRPPYQILDPHSHSEAALSLYLHSGLFAWVRLILGRSALAFESVFSEFAARRWPIRDAAYYPLDPPSHLLTAWIALEDVRSKSGPITCIPGSHRLPHFEFEEGRMRIRPEEEDYLPALKYTLGEAQKRGLEERSFLSRRAEVILWHAGFVHGEVAARDPRLRRPSFQVRFSTRQALQRRDNAYWKSVRGKLWQREPRLFWAQTERILERQGCVGLDNPIRGMNPRGLSLVEKIGNRLKGS